MELDQLFDNISPAELSKLRGRLQANSTRDKNQLLKSIKEIINLTGKLNYKIILISELSEDKEGEDFF